MGLTGQSATTLHYITGGAHRGSLPSTLPGGNDWYATTNRYRSGTSSRQTYLLKEKVQSPLHGSSSSRGSIASSRGSGGPLKADHNISVGGGGSRDRTYGSSILRPLSRQHKSSSLSDISGFRDITADMETRGSGAATGELPRRSQQYSSTRGVVTDSGSRTLPRYPDDTASLKSKSGSTTSGSTSRQSQYERIVDGVRSLATGGYRQPRDDTTTRNGDGRLSRRYRSLSDLNTAGSSSSLSGSSGGGGGSVKGSTTPSTSRREQHHEDNRTSPVVVGGGRRNTLDDSRSGGAASSNSAGRSVSWLFISFVLYLELNHAIC